MKRKMENSTRIQYFLSIQSFWKRKMTHKSNGEHHQIICKLFSRRNTKLEKLSHLYILELMTYFIDTEDIFDDKYSSNDVKLLTELESKINKNFGFTFKDLYHLNVIKNYQSINSGVLANTLFSTTQFGIKYSIHDIIHEQVVFQIYFFSTNILMRKILLN